MNPACLPACNAITGKATLQEPTVQMMGDIQKAPLTHNGTSLLGVLEPRCAASLYGTCGFTSASVQGFWDQPQYQPQAPSLHTHPYAPAAFGARGNPPQGFPTAHVFLGLHGKCQSTQEPERGGSIATLGPGRARY